MGAPADQAIKVIAAINEAYPNLNPTQIGEITGVPLNKGRIPNFWYSQPSAAFKTITAQIPPDRDTPVLMTFGLQEDVPLTTKEVTKKFGPPLANDDVKPGEPTKGLPYRRAWGTVGFLPDATSGRIVAAIFIFNK